MAVFFRNEISIMFCSILNMKYSPQMRQQAKLCMYLHVIKIWCVDCQSTLTIVKMCYGKYYISGHNAQESAMAMA